MNVSTNKINNMTDQYIDNLIINNNPILMSQTIDIINDNMNIHETSLEWEKDSNYSFDFNSVDHNSHNHHHIQNSNDAADNNTNSSINNSLKISDAQVYGPRFIELYNLFNSSLNLSINPSRHLMALCTDYLISFCQWARDSDERITFIRDKLMNHDYLRSEVRNGIVMVLIYTFASIKATLDSNSDMFSTLVDHEQGLGIANKFSLRIYNDPYLYLSFLKSSISSLIDAGAIPDNERSNQPKKNRSRFENKEELQAFTQIQSLLVGLLDSGNNVGARNLVSHITTYWQQRGKFLRNRKFVSALQSLHNGPIVTANTTIVPQTNNQMPTSIATTSTTNTSTNLSSNNPTIYQNNKSNSNIDSNFTYPYNSTENFTTTNTTSSSNTNTNINNNLSNNLTSFMLPVKTKTNKNSNVDIYNNQTANTNSNTNSTSLNNNSMYLTNQSSNPNYYYNDNISNKLSNSQVNEQLTNPLNSQITNQLTNQLSNQLSTQLNNQLTAQLTNTLTNQINKQIPKHIIPIIPTIPLSISLINPLTILKFNKIDRYEWDITESKVYNIDQFLLNLLTNNYISIYFINESILYPMISSNMKFTIQSNGVVQLYQELNKYLCIYSYWSNKYELVQFKEFIIRYQQYIQSIVANDQSNNNLDISLYDFWQAMNNSNELPIKRLKSANTSTISKGILVYETISLVGLVIRRNVELGINEDLWCNIYIKELLVHNQSNNQSNSKFIDYLLLYFPQLISLINNNTIIVKYFGHHLNDNEIDKEVFNIDSRLDNKQLPSLMNESLYKTIGLLSLPADLVLSRLINSLLSI